MRGPHGDVPVLARFERSDAAVDPQLFGGVDRHQRERLVLRQPAVFHGLGGFGVQAARQFGIVGIDRDEDALAHHDRGVVRRGVCGLHLVAPPVGEGGAAGAVRGDFLGDAISLQHVLERRDAEAHLLGQPDQHQGFVGAVGVRVDQPFAFEHLDERLELQVAARRNGQWGAFPLLDRLALLVVAAPLLLVGARLGERLTDHVEHAHAGRRVAAILAGRRRGVRALRVLAHRELDAGRSSLEQQTLGVGAPAQLDDRVPAADRVGAAVQDVGRGQAAGEVAKDVDVGGVQHVLDADHRAHRRAPFVDRIGGDVRMGIDEAWRDELARHVDDVGARRDVDVGADRGNLAVAEKDGPVRDRAAARHREHRGTAKRDDPAATLRLPGERCSAGLRQCEGNGQAKGTSRVQSANHSNLQLPVRGFGRPMAAPSQRR